MLGDFQFKNFVINNIDYKAKTVTEGEDLKEDKIQFSYTLTNKGNAYLLSVLIHIIDIQEDHYLDIKVESRGNFVFQDDADKDLEKREKTIKENGSAIMFPYIRSLIYNLTCADSCNTPLVMPVFNFSKIIENLDNQNKD